MIMFHSLQEYKVGSTYEINIIHHINRIKTKTTKKDHINKHRKTIWQNEMSSQKEKNKLEI